MSDGVRPEPHVFAVFGGTGDLAKRKLLPALCRAAMQNQLGEGTVILGIGRNPETTDDDYRQLTREALAEGGISDADLEAWCDRCVYYQPLSDGDAKDYDELRKRIEAIEADHKLPGHRAFYLATPPGAFAPTIRGLGGAGLNGGDGSTVRLVIEKPFGHDLGSAQELNRIVHDHFDESQVFRIDHYLGKETVQNLLAFRFANPVFESLWNRHYVDNVQITVSEPIGVEGRAGYYDGVGALRDMVQNHLTQILTLVAMEAPVSMEADAIRGEKVKVLQAIDPPASDELVRGQYAQGTMDGETVPGYLDADGVPVDSTTETFAALKLHVDNWRWKDVPFYLRTGKRLPDKRSQVAVTFREPPVCFFQDADARCELDTNVLLITLQPNEGFDLMFQVKRPASPMEMSPQTLRFRYNEAFDDLPDAYETLLMDVLQGDQTLFVRSDEVEAAWALYEPLLERTDVATYQPGTWGPHEAEELLASEGRAWRAP